MAVRRDVEVPATEQVTFARYGRVEQVSGGGNGQVFARLVPPDAKGRAAIIRARRAIASADPAGDDQRPGVAWARDGGISTPWARDGGISILALAGGAISGLVPGDWIWVEEMPLEDE